MRAHRSDAVVAVGVLLDELDVLVGTDHWPRITGERDDRERTEHGVDRPTFEPERAEVGAGQERSLRIEEASGAGRVAALARGLCPARRFRCLETTGWAASS